MTKPKHIVIAVDSFKGSLSSMEVADSIEKGIHSSAPHYTTSKLYIADGGEGSVEALVESLHGVYRRVTVYDPLMRKITAKYGVTNNSTAIIEMATASGLTLLDPTERNPMKTTTYGVGELIKDALDLGCRKFLICIGGSATNDAGTGMLQALGAKFYDNKGSELSVGGEILQQIYSIDLSGMDLRLKDSNIEVACDVTNPLYGTKGAAHIFAPQKGADSAMIELLDNGLRNFAAVVQKTLDIDLQQIAGAGAAGGLGSGLYAFMGGKLCSGIDMILSALNFEKELQSADLVITGEGKLDKQTLMGKAPYGVLKYATAHNVPVVAIGGSVEDSEILTENGFAAAISICPSPISLEWAVHPTNAKHNIEQTITELISTYKNEEKS